jgi:hypothetical protein
VIRCSTYASALDHVVRSAGGVTVAPPFSDPIASKRHRTNPKNMTPDFADHDGPGGKPTGVDGESK